MRTCTREEPAKKAQKVGRKEVAGGEGLAQAGKQGRRVTKGGEQIERYKAWKARNERRVRIRHRGWRLNVMARGEGKRGGAWKVAIREKDGETVAKIGGRLWATGVQEGGDPDGTAREAAEWAEKGRRSVKKRARRGGGRVCRRPIRGEIRPTESGGTGGTRKDGGRGDGKRGRNAQWQRNEVEDEARAKK